MNRRRVRWVRRGSTLVVLLLVATACEPTRYAYDGSGRLRGVTDPDGDTAVYRYDDLGNIVGVDRYPSTGLSIVEVSPDRAAVGDEIVIQGTGFGGAPAENTVEINGTAAPVTKAGKLELRVTVPQGATTGPIEVTTAAGSVTSPGELTVEPSRAPAITGFSSPVAAIGDEVRLDGRNFATDPLSDAVVLNGTKYATVTAAEAARLTLVVPPRATSGPVTVATPDGTATSPDDLFVAPAGYAAADVGFTARGEVGAPATLTIDDPDTVGLLVFDGEAGQRVNFAFADVTFPTDCGGVPVRLVAPSGIERELTQCPIHQGPVTLEDSGPYTLYIAPEYGETGAITVRIEDVPPDATGTLVLGSDPVRTEITAAGQAAELSLTGTAGQRVSIALTDGTFSRPQDVAARLFAPDGKQLASVAAFGGLLGPIVLPADGTYRIRLARIQSYGATGVTGQATFQAYVVPPDQTGPIVAGGAPVAVHLGVPGQKADLTFTAAAGDRVSAALTGNTIPSGVMKLVGPNGDLLTYVNLSDSWSDNFMDAVDLPVAGTYHLTVEGYHYAAGDVTLRLFAVPTGPATPIEPGVPAPVVIDVPGKDVAFTFEADAGDAVTIAVTDQVQQPTEAWWYLTLLAPDGAVVAAQVSDNVVHVGSLPADGTYRITIDASGESTGSGTLTLHAVPPDVAGDLPLDGTPVTVDIDTPGQGVALTFDGTAGQRVNIVHSYFDLPGARLRVLGPDGAQVFPDTDQWSELFPLPEDGEYRVEIIPWTSLPTGSTTLRAFDVPPDVTGELADGTPRTVALTAPGQDAQLTFTGTAGQRASLVFEDFPGVAVVTAPDGTDVLTRAMGGAPETWMLDLPAAGTYTVDLTFFVDFDPDWVPVTSTFTYHVVPPPLTGEIVADGGAYELAIDNPGQVVELTFAGTAGQEVSLVGEDSTFPHPSVALTLLTPSGTILSSRFLRGLVAEGTLPVTGTYKIRIAQEQGRAPGRGEATLRLYDVPDPDGGPIVADGPPVPVEIAVPGQAAEVSFTATAGQRVSLVAEDSTLIPFSALVHLFRPDGRELYATYFDAMWGALELPDTGTYRFRIEQYQFSEDIALGSATLRLHNVPPDTTGTIAIGGSAVTTGIDVPGRSAVLTFSATAGQRVNLLMTGSTFPDGAARVRVVNPNGSYLAAGFPDGTVGPMTLATTGTYKVIVEQWWDTDEIAVGDVTLQLALAGSPSASERATVDAAEEEPRPAAADGEAPPPTPPPAVDPAQVAKAAQAEAGAAGPVGQVAGRFIAGAAAAADPPQLVTRVTGTAQRIDGSGLPGVTVSVGAHQATTAADGTFSLDLTGIASGQQELIVDGHTADAAGAHYGTFVIGVDLVEGAELALPQTVWMPELDTAHTVHLDYPLTDSVVVTNPAIPGLEVHIPAGSEITDAAGQRVDDIGITPIPVDKTPFPLPEGIRPAQYFTLQPGGAALGPDGYTIVYPNADDDPTGTWFSLYDYSPADGWYVAGTGEVDASGDRIVPHDGPPLRRFTGALAAGAGYLAPPEGPSVGAGDHPIDLATGLFVHEATDLAVADVMPVTLSRTYRPEDPAVRAFGRGTSLSFDLNLWTVWPYEEADLVLPNGVQLRFQRTTPGTGKNGAVLEHTDTPTEFYGSKLTSTPTGWDLTLRSGTTFVFGGNTPLRAIRDVHGNEVTLVRADTSDGPGMGRVDAIYTPSGRWMALSYDGQDRITRARDHAGRTVGYAYDAQSRLDTVTNPGGGQITYGYDAEGRIETITGPDGQVSLTNTYDSDGRIASQAGPDGHAISLAYDSDASGRVTRAEVTDPRGIVRAVDYADGYWIHDTAAAGTPLEQTVSVERNPANRLITAQVDHLGRRTAFGYDARGNRTSVTTLDGTPGATTTRATYEPRFNKVATQTDLVGRTTRYDYDEHGNLATTTGPDGLTAHSTYDHLGRLTSSTDVLGNTTELGYELLHRVTATDPQGLRTIQFLDSVGREVAVTDPTGARTHTTYDRLDQVTAIVDGGGAETTFDYDDQGNLTKITDANGGATTVGYDDAGLARTYTDQLGAGGSYEYDELGRIVEHVDRRGLTSTIAYDDLGRTTTLAYGVTQGGAESTVTYQYNAAGQLSDLADSAYGTIHYDYDALDRMTAETSPQGRVAYTYQADSQPRTVTVDGGPTTTYDYDAVGRLRQVTQGSSVVTAHRNTIGQVTSLDLPNGVTGTYGYDRFGAFTKMSYAQGSKQLGDVSYSHDGLGRRSTIDGKLAETPAPAEVDTASYDAANRLTDWGTTTLDYDATGNLVDDGTNTYTWDARGQLVAVDGPVDATFDYDPMGRRTSKTVAGATTDFLYDGGDILQQRQGGGAPDTYLNGQGIDEVFARTSGSGAVSTFLTDAQGSTLALANGAGDLTTRYRYDAFGGTTVSGAADPNPFAYTGRELDGTGMYFYRARYYQPDVGRFISEDPLGYGGGGPNFYSYVNNNPTNATDPSGLCGMQLLMDLVGPGGFVDRWFGKWRPFEMVQPGWQLLEGGMFAAMEAAGATPFESYEKAMGELGVLVAIDCGLALVGAMGLGRFAIGAGSRAGGAAAGGGARAALPTSAKLNQETLEHIVYRHWSTTGFKNVGKFAPGTTARQLRTMIDETVTRGSSRPATLDRPGTIYEYDYQRHFPGMTIGTKGKNKPTGRLRVVLDPQGNVVTAFPY